MMHFSSSTVIITRFSHISLTMESERESEGDIYMNSVGEHHFSASVSSSVSLI